MGVSYATYTGVNTRYPLLSVQIGGPISEGLELRGTIESLVVASNLGLDVFYPLGLNTPDARLYVGGGVSTRFYVYYPYGFDLRSVFGGEYFVGSEISPLPLGFFGEVRTYFRGLLMGFPTVEGRVGLNLPY